MKTKTPKKRKPKTVAKLTKEAQEVFNAWIRRRDSVDGWFTCIACGRDFPIEDMNAGHYVPVKNSSLLRLDERNAHGECRGCNCFDQFHLIGYRNRLIDKVGLSTVEYLEENRRALKKWSRSELELIINQYKL